MDIIAHDVPISQPGSMVPYFISLIKFNIQARTQVTVRKATRPDLEVGLICADRDGNRVRIDRVAGTVSYHFLNDELRVQEGIQERSVDQFLAEGWYIAAKGTSL